MPANDDNQPELPDPAESSESSEPEHFSPWHDHRSPILMAVMATMALVAMDSTILATAVPSIVDDLSGFNQFPWLFSAYLLGQAVTVPVYGKVADMFGRKPVLLFGIGLFVLGSLAAGAAPSMMFLIITRALQGLGAGAVQSMALTIVGDIYTLRQRGMVQGYLASVWGVSSVLGPTLGGIFSQLGAWRWIFFLNVPVGLLAIFLIWRNYHEHLSSREHHVDIPGAVILTVALSGFILGTLEGGQAWPWLSWQTAAVYGGSVVLLIVLRFVEHRAKEPILEFDLLKRPLLITTSVIQISVGAVATGFTSFTPTYLQSSLGLAPIVAGLCVAAMSLAWPVASAKSALIYMTRGFRAVSLIGGGLGLAGTALLAATAQWPNGILVAIFAMVLGAGMGFTAPPSIVAAQNSVGWDLRGEVTALNSFSRSAGSALGVAFFGALSNSAIAAHGGSETPEAVIAGAQLVFLGLVLAAIMLAVAAYFMPAGRPTAYEEKRER